MIDVDVYNQLVPNLLTMVVQLLSTFVLFMVAYKMLWPAAKKYLAARADKMQEDLEQSEMAKKKAFEDREKALEQLNDASGKADEIVSAALKQAKDEKQSILAQADKEAQATKKKAHEQIEAEREAMYKDMQREMVEIAMSAASKLIGDKSVDEFDKEAIDAFVKEASSHD